MEGREKVLRGILFPEFFVDLGDNCLCTDPAMSTDGPSRRTCGSQGDCCSQVCYGIKVRAIPWAWL